MTCQKEGNNNLNEFVSTENVFAFEMLQQSHAFLSSWFYSENQWTFWFRLNVYYNHALQFWDWNGIFRKSNAIVVKKVFPRKLKVKLKFTFLKLASYIT